MNIQELIKLMARLRDPDGGCPWDLKQNFASIIPYTIEEVYEVAEAVDAGDMQELRAELGDLLFQVVFLSRLAEEQQLFDFYDVVATIVEKMTRRHPHVFGDEQYESEAAFKKAWDAEKRKENKTAGTQHESLLDGIGRALPALKRAQKVQAKVSRVGFDWSTIEPVFDKVDEEVAEIRQAIQQQEGSDRIAEEIGDLLFSVVNLSRHLKQDAEDVLRKATNKFEARFRQAEHLLQQQEARFEDKTEAELIALWDSIKAAESK